MYDQFSVYDTPGELKHEALKELFSLRSEKKTAVKKGDLDKTIEERGERYGEFADNAYISQALKGVMEDSPNWRLLPADSREALEQIAAKIARILNGDHQYYDNWHDIAGYATLVADKLKDDD